MKKIEIVARYGDLVHFKDYDDIWVVEDAVVQEDGKIRVTKLPDGCGFDPMSYQNEGKPIISRAASAIVVDKDGIKSVTALIDALKSELLFYNQHPSLSDRVCVVYMNEYSSIIEKAIQIVKITEQTVLLQVCTNDDQRFYIPVVKDDRLWDVRVRYLVYKHYLPK